MTAADVSHLIYYVILGLGGLGVITMVGAMLSLGRSSYKKD